MKKVLIVLGAIALGLCIGELAIALGAPFHAAHLILAGWTIAGIVTACRVEG